MIRQIPGLILCLLLAAPLLAQQKEIRLNGEVSFVTTKNVYVKFDNTKDIDPGDTLYTPDGNTACLVVNNKSSRSCVCTPIGDCLPAKGDKILFIRSIAPVTIPAVVPVKQEEKAQPVAPPVVKKEIPVQQREEISGRVSVSGYSLINDKRDNITRLAGRLSFNVKNIRNSRFSFSSYMAYRQNFTSRIETGNRKTIFFNVYDLALKYEINNKLMLLLGRKINPKMSSVGAIDGLQAEGAFGRNYIGAIAGTRPGISDYSFDPSLLQYGAYYSRGTAAPDFSSMSTIGYMEQRNSGKLDRRYLYFQHSSTVFRNLILFGSFEADLYKTINGQAQNGFQFTNLYASARYRFGRRYSLLISYITRKRIIYYETFKTEIERLLDDDIARQGARITFRARPLNFLSFGLSYSKRFQSDSRNPSDNINVNAGFSRVFGGRISLSYNYNTSDYLKSNAGSIRYTRTLTQWMSADFYYRFLFYDFYSSGEIYANPRPMQNYFGTNLSFFMKKRFTFSTLAEYSTVNDENNFRFYLKLAKRFRSKSKNVHETNMNFINHKIRTSG